MKRLVSVLVVLTFFVLSSSVVLAKGGGNGQGKGSDAAGSVEKGKGKAVQEAISTEETMRTQKQNAEKEITVKKEKAQGQEKATERKMKAEKEKVQNQEKAPKDADDAGGKGKDKAQKGEALAKQITHESTKHQKRQERLQKMLQVAQDAGNEKAVGRIQKLMEKESNHYQRKNTKMTERTDKGVSEKGQTTAAVEGTAETNDSK